MDSAQESLKAALKARNRHDPLSHKVQLTAGFEDKKLVESALENSFRTNDQLYFDWPSPTECVVKLHPGEAYVAAAHGFAQAISRALRDRRYKPVFAEGYKRRESNATLTKNGGKLHADVGTWGTETPEGFDMLVALQVRCVGESIEEALEKTKMFLNNTTVKLVVRVDLSAIINASPKNEPIHSLDIQCYTAGQATAQDPSPSPVASVGHAFQYHSSLMNVDESFHSRTLQFSLPSKPFGPDGRGSTDDIVVQLEDDYVLGKVMEGLYGDRLMRG